MKILVENSVWTNVGNGWFSFSLYYLMKKLYPDAEVFMGEGPIDLSFRITKDYQRKNALNVLDYERADVHVFNGPIMSMLISEYGVVIPKLIERGESYCLISASGTNIPQEKRKALGEFLQKYPPIFFASRDEETYNAFKDYVPVAYNGVCTATLLGRTMPNLQTFQLEKPFFISSFYTQLEPTFSVPNGEDATIENVEVEHHKTLWHLPYDIARHLNYRRNQQEEVGNKLIVRTLQNLNTKFNHINFAMPNSFISFNPIKYLEVVKSSEFTISDRVHACVISLALGHPARFLFETPRAGIFDRMGWDYKSNNGIMYPNMEKVDEELEKLSAQIKKYI